MRFDHIYDGFTLEQLTAEADRLTAKLAPLTAKLEEVKQRIARSNTTQDADAAKAVLSTEASGGAATPEAPISPAPPTPSRPRGRRK
jgi:hypothetical protein